MGIPNAHFIRRPPATGESRLDWKMTDKVAGVEFAGLENDGLENDGLEQEQTYVLHTLKTFNVYDM